MAIDRLKEPWEYSPKAMVEAYFSYYVETILLGNLKNAQKQFEGFSSEKMNEVFDFRNNLTPNQLLINHNKRYTAGFKALLWLRKQDE